MKSRRFKKLRIAVVAVALLAIATPAWAGIAFKGFCVFLEGVDRYGCLTDCGGQCATFCAVVNTCTGQFVGTARGCVENKSCRSECYQNVNFFCDPCINVLCSIYTVTKCGQACYVAVGCHSNSPPA